MKSVIPPRRSRVESELYQKTKHLHTYSDETLEQVVAGERAEPNHAPTVDVAFPPDDESDLL